jgi:hypothetical protein
MFGMETLPPSFEPACEFGGPYANIPPHMQESIRRYVVNRIAPGHFLQGVITNDLRMAVNHADETNLPLIKLYVQWFYNQAPAGCTGSRETMLQWLSERASDQAPA